jgi:hypothetical protein
VLHERKYIGERKFLVLLRSVVQRAAHQTLFKHMTVPFKHMRTNESRNFLGMPAQLRGLNRASAAASYMSMLYAS